MLLHLIFCDIHFQWFEYPFTDVGSAPTALWKSFYSLRLYQENLISTPR